MSFSTGEIQDGSGSFIRLACLKNIEESLSRTKSWKVPRTNSRISVDHNLTNIEQARFIWYFFETYLTRNQDEWEAGLIEETKWNLRG